MKHFALILTAALVYGCSYTETNHSAGQIHAFGQPAGQMEFDMLFDSRAGTTIVTATAPDGEEFTGLAVQDVTTEVIKEGGFYIGYSDGSNGRKKGVTTRNEEDEVKTTRFPTWKANLTSESGNSMDCIFTARNITYNFIDDSFGNCTVSDGRVVQVDINQPSEMKMRKL